LIPHFQGASTFYYFGSGVTAEAQTRYTYLGHNLKEVLFTISTQPDLVLSHVLTPDKFAYLLELLVPLGFITLVSPEIALLMLPTLGYSLLSTFSFQYSIQSFYTAPLLPSLFFASIGGLERLLKFGRWKTDPGKTLARKWTLGVLILVASSISYYLFAPGPFARAFKWDEYDIDSHSAIGRELIATIPAQANVAAQTELVAHLSARRFIYEFPTFPQNLRIDYLIADRSQLWYTLHQSSWDAALSSGEFEIILKQDGFVIAAHR
jgi:uncharacterized membrane protein